MPPSWLGRALPAGGGDESEVDLVSIKDDESPAPGAAAAKVAVKTTVGGGQQRGREGGQDKQLRGWRLPGRRPRTAPLLVKALLINALLLCRVLSHALPLLLTLAYCFPLL